MENNAENFHRAFYLDESSEFMEVTDGVGRGAGETVRILENGNLYSSGFEFIKKGAVYETLGDLKFSIQIKLRAKFNEFKTFEGLISRTTNRTHRLL